MAKTTKLRFKRKSTKLFKKRAAKKKHDKYSEKISKNAIGTVLSRNMLTGAGDGQPQHKNVVLRYAETFTFSTGTLGAMSSVQYMKLNSLFDPNGTAGGHQPYLFDTWAALYNNYRVNCVKVDLLWSTCGGSAEIACCHQISGPNAYLAMNGLSLDRVTEMNNVGSVLLSPSGNSRTVRQTFYLPIHKLMGISKKKYVDDPNFQNDVLHDPPTLASLQLATGSYSGVGSEGCACQVVITYYASLWDRKYQSQS